MGQKTDIEWTDTTWGPVRGCSRVSSGCQNCYAERFASRYAWPSIRTADGTPHELDRKAGPFHGFAESTPSGPRWTGRVELIRDKLDEPLRWRKPRRIFVNSMSDLFHESLSDIDIDSVFAVMAQAERHTFQVLTKRPKRMGEWFERIDGLGLGLDGHARERGTKMIGEREYQWPLPNVWLGVSVEDQATADARIPLLLETPAAVRFVSAEPLLSAVNLKPWVQLWRRHHVSVCVSGALRNRAFAGLQHDDGRPMSRQEAESELRRLDASGVKLIPSEGCDDFDPEKGCRGHPKRRLDWVIVGGESGPGARPCDVSWIRSIVDQCKAASVPCFVKQVGGHPTYDASFSGRWPGGTHAVCGNDWVRRVYLRNRKGGDPSEWPEDLRVREFPEVVTR